MLNQTIIPELKQEAAQTKKILEKVPFDQWQWKPHAKSMALGRLASHVAELPKWITMCINTDELDFSKRGYTANVFESREQLLQHLDQNIEEALATLGRTT